MKKRFRGLFAVLMLLSIVSAVFNIIFFIFTNDNMYLFISMISLFIVGITVLVFVINSDNDNSKFLDKYIILDKEEYEVLKNKLYDQENEIKKLKAAIKK